MQLLGLQGFWQHQVLRGVGSQGSRKYSVLEGYGSQYWPIRSSILAWRTPLSDREAWQATVYRVAKSWTLPKQPCTHRHKIFLFFLPVAALPQGELSMKMTQLLGLWGPWLHQVFRDTDCLHHRSYGPIRDFFQASCKLAIRRPLWPVFLHSSTRSGTWKAPLPGVLLCCSLCPAHRGVLLAAVYSVDQCIRNLKGHPGLGSYSVVQCVRHLMD